MTNVPKEPWPKAITVVLLALGLMFGTFGLLISSVFVLMFWYTYWVFPEEGWRAPLFMTGLWLASFGAMTSCALVAFSRRSWLQISVAVAVLLIGVVAVATTYVELSKPDGASPNLPIAFG